MQKLDFKNDKVMALFFKQLFPALLGMIASAIYVVVDGIFVGQGVGSNGIAAVNINNPLMTFVSGLGLMFGMGGGVITALHLSRGQRIAARRVMTQTVLSTFIISVIITLLLCTFPHTVGYWLGADQTLIDDVATYMFWYAQCFPFMVMMTVLPFFIRLTNPNIPMWALSIGAVLNVILDYLFIFVFHWGLAGAAVATDIGQTIGALIMFFYLLHPNRVVSFIRPKINLRTTLFTLRHIRYMMILGFSVFLGEITVSIMGVAGNYAFMQHLGPAGVAAYSIVCYVFPVIFMVFNATVQSAQPIISYNYGCGQLVRSQQALRLALLFAVGMAALMAFTFLFVSSPIVSLFIPDHTNAAWQIAVDGLPYFAADFVFFGINTVIIGYYMSLERLHSANVLTLIRGMLPVIFFFTLPSYLGNIGLWLAVALADFGTTLTILLFIALKRYRNNG